MQDFTQLKDERECVLVVVDDDLRVCAVQKAHNFTVNLYKMTANFPPEEKFGLTNQIRRASVSIESNLGEGCGRNGDKEFSRFIERKAKLFQSSKTTI